MSKIVLVRVRPSVVLLQCLMFPLVLQSQAESQLGSYNLQFFSFTWFRPSLDLGLDLAPPISASAFLGDF